MRHKPQPVPYLEGVRLDCNPWSHTVVRRVRLKEGGAIGTVVGAQIFVGQWWCPVLWDGQCHPDWCKSVALELVKG